MDGLTTRRLVTELNQQLTGSRIEKIYQPNYSDLVFSLRAQGIGQTRLLMSAHKQFARVHLLQEERPDNPKEPPMFCMLMRKHIENGRISGIVQQGNSGELGVCGWDRVVEIHIEALDELGDVRMYRLICELMGRHSNVILCREEGDKGWRIIDAIVRVTEGMSRHREVVPGAPYVAPPEQHKHEIAELTASDFSGIDPTVWNARANAMYLVDKISGLGPVSAREILHRASQAAMRDGSKSASDITWREATSLITGVMEGNESATVALDELGRATECAPFQLTHRGAFASCPSMSEAIRRRFADNGEMLYHSHLQDELRRVAMEHLDKLRGKRTKLEQSLAESLDESIYRVKAELLTAYAHQIEKGETRVVLPNYYEQDEPLAIELQPALSPIENAQRYFKFATKRKRAATTVAEQLAQTRLDIRYLDEVLESVRDTALDNLEQVRRELISQGFMQEKPQKQKGKRKPVREEKREAKPDEFLSEDGYLIRVGRNNLQNDRLTLRQSDKADVWLHVKDQPGSHVVIRRDGPAEVPEETIEEAALLAAYFSRGRDSANVAVDITEIRHVWKPNGARPGLALYNNQRTLFVTPERALLHPILTRSQGAPASS